MDTLITAHSGCDGTPDNSLEFVKHALSCGADAFEIDVRCRDGRLFMSHDVTDMECPGLNEVFRLMQGSSMKINCDLKEPNLEEAVLELAEKLGIWDNVLFSGDVSLEKMRTNDIIRRKTLLNIDPLVGQVTPEELDDRLEELVEGCRRCGAWCINIHYGKCTEKLMKRMREAGIQISAWTVNREEVARRLLDEGIYNITSRSPGMVMALR